MFKISIEKFKFVFLKNQKFINRDLDLRTFSFKIVFQLRHALRRFLNSNSFAALFPKFNKSLKCEISEPMQHTYWFIYKWKKTFDSYIRIFSARLILESRDM